jgi:hypothetical protein
MPPPDAFNAKILRGQVDSCKKRITIHNRQIQQLTQQIAKGWSATLVTQIDEHNIDLAKTQVELKWCTIRLETLGGAQIAHGENIAMAGAGGTATVNIGSVTGSVIGAVIGGKDVNIK